MAGHIVSCNGEIVNLDNVIYAKPQAEFIKLLVVGSAGAGKSDSYSVQHREIATDADC